MNPTGMNIVCFSCFFCACLCLCCLQLSFRALGIVWVSSHSFGVKIDTFFFWTPYSIRNVLTSFENCSQLARPVGIPDQPVEQFLLGSPSFRNTLDCFNWFSLVWAWN